MGRAGEQLPRLPLLNQPSGVKHRDVVGDLGHHGEVVGNVDGGHLVGPAQPAHGVQDAALGGDVQVRRRLVEHDQPRPAGERHGQGHPLLLASGELVRVGGQNRGGVLQAGLDEHLGEPAGVGAVDGEDLAQLCTDLQHRVQGAGRVLRDVGDRPAAQLLQLMFGQREDIPAVDEHHAAAEFQPALDQPEQGQPDRRLPRARLAYQAEHLPGLDSERDLVDDVGVRPPAARRHQDPQVLHREPRRARGRGGTLRRGAGRGHGDVP